MRLQGPSGQTACSRLRGRSWSCNKPVRQLGARVRAASTEQAAPAPAAALEGLPRALRDATAVLQAPGGAAVYVLGVSHVSQAGCEQVRQLIGAVKPEVVVVEVCKDRTGLLVDPESMTKAPDTWICTRVSFDGLPSNKKPDPAADDKKEGESDDAAAARRADAALAFEVWPAAAELAPLLRTRIGRVLATSEVEGDVATLEATGLFRLVRPVCDAGRRGDAPLFSAVKAEGGAGGLELEYVTPLGCTRFIVEPRALPPVKSMAVRLDSSLKASGVTQEQLDAVAADAVAACAADPPRAALLSYLTARRRLIDLVRGAAAAGGGGGDLDVIVEFAGAEAGVAEAVVRARRPGDGDAPFVSGLEASAEDAASAPDGAAPIDRFRPLRRGVQLSPRMSLPAEAAARMNALKAARRAEAALTARGGGGSSSGAAAPDFRFWKPEEVAPADLTSPEPSPGPDALAMVLTGVYSSLQSKAGRAVGLEPGAAWRAAMEAATENGASLFVLGDRPAFISQRRLADAMYPETAARLAAAATLVVAGAAAGRLPAAVDLVASSGLPGAEAAAGAAAGAAALAVGLAAAAAALWPILGPLVEVWRFSQLDAKGVEEAVAVKEPIQANLDTPLLFWGEDALLRWPGAMGPLIAERDAYMARVAAAAAVGAPPGAPAYVAGEAGGQLVWRYAMADGGPEGASPKGLGEGAYAPPRGVKSVVVVVGTAHVRGMCRAWGDALARPGDVGELAPAAEAPPEESAKE
ncbi:MAG: hypothetical protein J3K34DRAFT_118612 [Monoraphidium minutum]|nr:MAG: hypothetical protein J3K34DRAFT_118612 [Monoraphidium minutum]